MTSSTPKAAEHTASVVSRGRRSNRRGQMKMMIAPAPVPRRASEMARNVKW